MTHIIAKKLQPPPMTRYRWVALAMIMFSLLAMFSANFSINETDDELFHVRCGMEWWNEGTYKTQALHPPLARVAGASLLYVYEQARGKKFHEGHSKVDGYYIELWLTRLGIIPFYIFSCLVVLRWARQFYGREASLWSLGAYVTLSTVTAHGMLATTDMVYTAMLVWMFYVFTVWLDKPTRRRSGLLGLSAAATLGSKYSAIMHAPVGIAVILMMQFMHNYKHKLPRMPLSKQHWSFAGLFVIPTFVFVLWLIFHMDFAPLIQGIKDAYGMSAHGVGVWFNGPWRLEKSFWFFPIVFFYKTPLSFFAAIFFSLFFCIKDLFQRRMKLSGLLPFVVAAALLAASMKSNIHLGVRHVLPVYPLLAIFSGYGLQRLWKQRTNFFRILVVFLSLCQLISFTSAHPEHIPYFNILAGKHPERITLDSDYDWGQSMILLGERLERKSIKTYYLCARRDAVWSSQFVVNAKRLPCPSQRPTGWVAISRAQILLKPNLFTWLNEHEGVEPIGATLDLYYYKPEEEKKEDTAE